MPPAARIRVKMDAQEETQGETEWKPRGTTGAEST